MKWMGKWIERALKVVMILSKDYPGKYQEKIFISKIYAYIDIHLTFPVPIPNEEKKIT